MSIVYKYRLYCQSESKYKMVWGEENIVPTKCPDDSNHTISSVSIVEKKGDNIVKIQEESHVTGGHFKITSKKIIANPNTTTISIINWKYPVSISCIEYTTVPEHKGDILDCIIAPDTVIGNITDNVNIGATVIHVSDTVIQNIAVGFKCALSNGSNKEDLGEVISIDKTNKTITVDTASTRSFLATTPTYVLMSIHIFDNVEIGEPCSCNVGNTIIGGAGIHANTDIKILYKNNSASTKEFVYTVHYLY